MKFDQSSTKSMVHRVRQMRQDLRLGPVGREGQSLTTIVSKSWLTPVCRRAHSGTNVEITLCSDSEFFHLLTSELASLEALQSRAEREIKANVVAIGGAVTGVATPKSANSKSDLYPWREIFRIYVESGIFFSNRESENHQERTVEKAQEQLELFNSEVHRLRLRNKFKNPYSLHLLHQFVSVNMDVLRVMRFQAINKLAMTKILKSTSRPVSSYIPCNC